MSILVNRSTKVVVQGVTGAYGQNQTRRMLEYGTRVVGGVSPGKGGTTSAGVAVYDTVQEAVRETGADTSIIYVPAPYARDAAIEAIEAGIGLVVVATEGIPVQDTMLIKQLARQAGTWMVGPNTMGLITPDQCLLGSAMPSVASPGPVGVISRSGTLMGEMMRYLHQGGFGQSTAISIGGDMVIGRNPVDYLREFESDSDTRAVVMLGEIGGLKEYEAAEYIREMKTPVIALIVGRFAPPGKRMGHVGAMIRGDRDTAEAKREALRQAGATVADTPWQVVDLLGEVLQRDL